jgi:colanic acid biosynthesis glycosyl transferase WcaI
VQLIFEGGGPLWQSAQSYSRQLALRSCCWYGYASEQESAYTFDCCKLIVATQRAEAQGLLWPSKLARALPTTKPLLWIGPSEGAIARSLRDRPYTGCFPPDKPSLIADWIENLFTTWNSERVDSSAFTQAFTQERKNGCETWRAWLDEVTRKGI